MIDSHCHLADKQFSKDLPAVLRRAEEAGVGRCIVIADDLDESEKCLVLAEKYEQLFCTVGVHPHAAKRWEVANLGRLRTLLSSSEKVKAIGEIGLDYFYHSTELMAGDHSPRDVQRDVFRVQLQLAKELSLPAVVHCRDAIDDLKAIIHEVDSPSLVLHCCAEKWEDVLPLVERGYFLSFTGIATYTNAHEIRRTMRLCPLEQLMLETDAPYLAPVPHRGKRNEPAYMVEVARLLADLKKKPLAEIDAITTANTVAFFRLPA
ncbi:MAG TPA: TatD family hydrolase [Candidatus Peribacteraceae bacterium]|nr:TatD family hydrolase [Candidatus Peribacteraceae bacterium]